MHTNGCSLAVSSDLRTAFFWAITQRLVIIPRRRFGTTYWPHFHESKIQEISHRNDLLR
jgi:hypothetical protein